MRGCRRRKFTFSGRRNLGKLYIAPSVKLHVTPSRELNASCARAQRMGARDCARMARSQGRRQLADLDLSNHGCAQAARICVETKGELTVIMWARRRRDAKISFFSDTYCSYDSSPCLGPFTINDIDTCGGVKSAVRGGSQICTSQTVERHIGDNQVHTATSSLDL